MAQRGLSLPTTLCAWLLAACGDGDSGFCPAGTQARLLTDAGGGEEQWCRDGDGVAQGRYISRDAVGRLRIEGGFIDDIADGRWAWYYPNGGGLQFEQRWRSGVEHGAFTEYDREGRRAVEQHFNEGRACDTWRRWVAGTLLGEVAYPACASLPPLTVDPGGEDVPDWDGASCPEGERKTLETELAVEIWCDVNGARHGPYRRTVAASNALPVGQDSETLTLGRYAAGLPDGPWRRWRGARQVHASHYVQGLLEGPWKTWSPDGAPREVGTYAAGRRVGAWREFYPNGTVRDAGAYVDDLRDGEWTRSAPGAAAEAGVVIARTTWRAGERHGPHATFYPDGAPETEGAWVDGAQSGLWTTRYPDGDLLEEETFSAGLREGPARGYLPGGVQAYEGRYEAGLRAGLWRTWSYAGGALAMTREVPHVGGLIEGAVVLKGPTGVVLARTAFVAGQRHGLHEAFHPDGARAERGEYRADLPEGRWMGWFASGAVSDDVGYQLGLRHGLWRRWWPNAQPRMEATYHLGVLEEARFWREDGQPSPGLEELL